MMYSPELLHGATGFWDEVIYVVGFIVSIILFIALALGDRKREKETDDEKDKGD